MMNITWEVEVDEADSDEWSRLLEQFDDATSLSNCSVRGSALGKKNLSRIVLKRAGEVVGIAQLRIICPTPLKCGIAYLRWGPLWERRGHESRSRGA